MENQDKQTVNLDEQTAQTNEQTVQSNVDTDWKSLQEKEVEYNRKLRGKNQELEKKLEEFEKQQASARQKKMEEAGEFKAIVAEKDSLIEKLTTQVNEFNAYKKNKKTQLLETFSEDDRESFSHLPLADIEKLSKRFNKQAQNVANVPEGRDNVKDEFGGYSSLEEFAIKDPRGAEKYLAENVKGYKWGQ